MGFIIAHTFCTFVEKVIPFRVKKNKEDVEMKVLGKTSYCNPSTTRSIKMNLNLLNMKKNQSRDFLAGKRLEKYANEVTEWQILDTACIKTVHYNRLFLSILMKRARPFEGQNKKQKLNFMKNKNLQCPFLQS